MGRRPRDDLADDWLDSHETIVDSALKLDETLIWVGRPVSRMRLAIVEAPDFLCGVFLLPLPIAFLSFALFGQDRMAGREHFPPFPLQGMVFAVFAACLVAPACFLIFFGLRSVCRVNKICYALTSQRAIVCQIDHRGCLILEDLSALSLDLLEVRERADGTGDLIFGRRPSMLQGVSRPFGFLHVANVVEIEALMRQTLGKLAS